MPKKCSHDADIREIRNDIKKILPVIGKVSVHNKIIMGIVLALIGYGVTAIAGG